MLRMKLGKRWVGMPSVPAPENLCLRAFLSCFSRLRLHQLYPSLLTLSLLTVLLHYMFACTIGNEKMSCAAIGFMVHQQLEPSFKGRPKHEHYRQLLSVIGILLEFENKIQPKNRVFNYIGNYKPYRYSLSGSATSLKRVTVVNSQT